jgi:hypothetical protein
MMFDLWLLSGLLVAIAVGLVVVLWQERRLKQAESKGMTFLLANLSAQQREQYEAFGVHPGRGIAKAGSIARMVGRSSGGRTHRGFSFSELIDRRSSVRVARPPISWPRSFERISLKPGFTACAGLLRAHCRLRPNRLARTPRRPSSPP